MDPELTRLHEALQKRFDALRARIDKEGISPEEQVNLTKELRALCDEANSLLQRAAPRTPPSAR